MKHSFTLIHHSTTKALGERQMNDFGSMLHLQYVEITHRLATNIEKVVLYNTCNPHPELALGVMLGPIYSQFLIQCHQSL